MCVGRVSGVFAFKPMVLYVFWTGRGPQRATKTRSVEALERDSERGKPLFRRKRGKVRNLDDSDHKGLAEFFGTDSQIGPKQPDRPEPDRLQIGI